MNIENVLPTRGELEKQLAQTLQSIYRQKFKHPIGKISCHLFNNKVAIVAEDTVTKVEKVLIDNSQLDLALRLRSVISEAFTAQVKQVVGDILQVEVIDLVSDSDLKSGHLGILVFLNSTPKMRLPKKMRSSKQKILSENQVVFKPTDTSETESEKPIV